MELFSKAEKHQGYLQSLAECVSILTENLNMQMETEFSDLLDRRLMSLYGISGARPLRQDMAFSKKFEKNKAILHKKVDK